MAIVQNEIFFEFDNNNSILCNVHNKYIFIT
jgi:hypothetical protein